ncbi:MAG: YfhO family protein [Candidatus Edwardsbacteria bacterium]|nr:YfhO family protein [Candidatus Edwardsbacteria bacterium]
MKKKRSKPSDAAAPIPPLAPRSLFDRWYVALGLMAAAVLLFFGRALFSDRMLFGTDFIAGAYMTRAYIIAGIRNFGAAPLWYAGLYGGVPLTSVGSIAGDYWYPLLWPLYQLALAPHRIVLFGYCLHVLLGGVGTYLFMRGWKISGAAAFVAGAAYMFTGSVVSLIYAGHDAKIIVSALLPWLLLFIGRTVETRKLLWSLCGGLVVGLALMSPHVQMSYYLLLAGLFYAAGLIYVRFRRERRWHQVAVTAGVGAIMLVVGFAIYAVQALTLRDYMKSSPRGEDKGYAYATSYSMPPEEIVNTVWPEFSGLLDAGSDERPTRWYWGRRDLKLHTEYVGVVPALLALIGLWCSRRRKLKWFLAGLGCFALVVAFGGFTPFYHAVYALVPMMSKFRSPAMIFSTFAFVAAALAALGVQALLAGDAPKKLPAWLATAAGAGLLFGIIFSSARDGITGILEAFAAKGWGSQALWNSYPEMVKGYWIAFALFLAGAVLAVLLARRRMPLAWWTAIVALLVFLELWRVDARFFTLVDPPGRFFARDEVAAVLERDTTLHRVWPLQVHQQGNYLTLFGIQTVGGEHPSPLKRYNEFVGASPKRILPDFHNLIQHPQFLRLLGVKYLLMQGPVEHPDLVLHDSCYGGRVRIYRNTRALPRAWLAGEYEVIGNDARILARMQRPDFDPAKTVILEQAPSGFAPHSQAAGSAEVVRYTPNEVSVSVNAGAPALLVLSDNHFPAWKAFVDNVPAECLRADYTFRAVAVPAGAHTVEFRYHSGVYRTGKIISLVALLLTLMGIAALAAREIVNRKRRTGPVA